MEEERGREFVLAKPYTNLDDVPNLAFEDSTDYRSLFFKQESSSGQKTFKKFKDSDCINKFLPGKISDIQHTDESNDHNSSPENLNLNVFPHDNRGGCLSINIRYNDKGENRGIIGKFEFVSWNKSYGTIMSSIISNLKGKFNFVNKLTYLQAKSQVWDVQGSVIWTDSSSTDAENKTLKFSLGKNETFSLELNNINNENKLETSQEYSKLLLWSDPNQSQKTDSVMGYWKMSINGKDADLWQDRTKFKKDTEFTSKSFYKHSNHKWLKNRNFKFDLRNNLQWAGKWVDIKRRCINANNQLKDENLCFIKKPVK